MLAQNKNSSQMVEMRTRSLLINTTHARHLTENIHDKTVSIILTSNKTSLAKY